MTNIKQVIVIRKDLKMRRGKEIAQGAHASMAFLTSRLVSEPFVTLFDPGKRTATFSLAEVGWIDGAFTKVVCIVNSEDELMELHQRAEDAGLQVYLITDSGLTEFSGVPTRTCLAIGPDFASRIDPVTGHLKLY